MPPAIICNPLLFISSSFKLPYLRYNIARTQLEERQDSKANTNEKYHNRCTSVQVSCSSFFYSSSRGEKNMAAFAGTQQKCMACDKTVYLVDKLTADNRIYHKACFRCHHCRSTLKLSNYSSFEGVLYCRPHYDQLFKRTGSLDKSFEGTPKIVKPEKPVDNENASKVSNLFAGTREKCVGCNKTVYPIEKVSVNGTPYHRSCFKCTHGGCTISPANYIAHEGKLYCKHHHIQLFKEKGNYSQLENERAKNPVTVNITAVEIAAES